MPDETNKKAVFYAGIRLWKTLKFWKPVPATRGDADRPGYRRKLARMGHRSPNFLYDISVHTAVPPIGASVISDLDRQGSFNATMLQVQKSLVEASTPLQALSWVQSITEVLDVTGVTPPGSYPGAGAIQYNDGTKGFTPASGDYVLVREPTGEAGFIMQVTSAGTGTIGGVLQEAIDSSWEVLLTRFHFPETKFLSLQGWQAENQMEDSYAFDVAYLFRSQAHPVWASKYNVTLGI